MVIKSWDAHLGRVAGELRQVSGPGGGGGEGDAEASVNWVGQSSTVPPECQIREKKRVLLPLLSPRDTGPV